MDSGQNAQNRNQCGEKQPLLLDEETCTGYQYCSKPASSTAYSDPIDHPNPHGATGSCRPKKLLAVAAADLMSTGESSSRQERRKSKKNKSHFNYSSLEKLSGSSLSDRSYVSTHQRMWYMHAVHQVPAVLLLCLLNLMISIPFGVSYFPIGWRASDDADGGNSNDIKDEVDGAFPIPGKQALGIRMFLFSTIVGQVIFTFSSKFKNPASCQMVENVPFCHSLAYIVISEQGYGEEALSTLFLLLGFSSVLVGIVFYLLGRLEMGKVIYFFPSHVLLGCIAGIGIFMAVTAIEVTTDEAFSFSMKGIQSCIKNSDLLGLVVLFEVVLRLLVWATKYDGKPRYPLLPPIYFCLITPIFYLALLMFGIPKTKAEDAGYFFPSPDLCEPDNGAACRGSLFDDDVLAVWRVINFTTISWSAVAKSIPTMISLIAFSLIHVPINIPAFAISTNVEADFNAELIAHGYSNVFAGMLGGLQNYMTYGGSMMYANAGGEGKGSSLAVSIGTAAFFFIGPSIASYIPRCMAGTLLLHLGVDLFIEGIYDSYENFDWLEYGGIWLITIVMTMYGMAAALLAGIASALSVYAAQSVSYQNPIRGTMTATSLRSSLWNRPAEASAVLDNNEIGRKKILVVQLQGHLFFGNVAQLTDSIKATLEEKKGTQEEPWIVIMDFTLVLGMDSSAAQAIGKLKDTMRKRFHIDVAIFVSGSRDGFPCKYDLSQELSCVVDQTDQDAITEEAAFLFGKTAERVETDEPTSLLYAPRISMSSRGAGFPAPESLVCDSLDSALIFAEDVLIARENPYLMKDFASIGDSAMKPGIEGETQSTDEEVRSAINFLSNLCPGEDLADVEHIFSLMKREVYEENEIIWKQGSVSDCAKLLVKGQLMSMLENEEGTLEQIPTGAMLGELGLVNGMDRLSTVRCISMGAVLYSLDREDWNALKRDNPKLARFIDSIAVRYLAHRVQHVSNRIFETRCLPV
uniref:Cyclic nucleotide-binding domain-containing protein n=1 Tax=Helicotheca tamesis TaxID=374047 RepID=A0A7S2GZ62_9STRA|mmetsp:Transcript_13590/g.18652  ORF Transcript_13590/g.18652 Transcript_13590/m.18652 type:complete len:972 (+) Transcript_13590:130-3045(+)